MTSYYDSLTDYNNALDVLSAYFKQHVELPTVLQALLGMVEDSRKQKTVTIRAMHQRVMDYRKEHKAYSRPTGTEKQM